MTNFSFTDDQLGLAPAQNVTLNASISAQFDEILGVFGNHYPKTESSTNIGVKIHSSTTPPPQVPSPTFNPSWSLIMPWVLLGSFVVVLSSLVRMLLALPRPISYGSRFQDPHTRRFVGSKAAVIAYLTVGFTVLIWALGNLGTPDNFLAYGELVFGGLTGNFPLSAGLSVANYSLGALLHLKK